MAYGLRKIYAALTALVIAGVGPVHGDSPACAGQEVCCTPKSSCKGFISAEVLYWRAFQDGLDCGCGDADIVDVVNADGTIRSTLVSHGKSPNFEWGPGYRIGAGYELGCWDVGVFYTSFHSRHHKRNHHNNNVNLTNLGHPFRWKLNYQVVDLLIGREFNSECCFYFRPFAGLRGVQIHQKLRTHSISAQEGINGSSESFSSSFDNNAIVPFTSFTTIQSHSKQRYRGIGPILGLDAEWNVGCGFSIYGSAAISILYGRFKNHAFATQVFENGSNICIDKHRNNSTQSVLDAALGIRWTQCLCNMEIIYQVGWEHHRYFNHNHIGGYGDLSFDGANFGAAVAF